MPHKLNSSKRHHFKKHTYRQSDYAEYNQSLRDRGRIDIWLSDEIMDNWQSEQRTYDGTGSSPKFPDSTIITCHYLRLIFKQPLRQTQGFIDSLLKEMGHTELVCPDYSSLSKRLSQLSFKTPAFKFTDKQDEGLAAIAIDSTGLKEFGKGEWHQEKEYGRRNVSENAMHRYKTIIGPKLHSRDFNNQQQEMMLGASIFNRFTQLGMPDSYRVA
ncbi:transposase [Vibrio artabrorum]|uniref:transposase n=1 Tax=Vibrio artabrorum TaxID=446374 RepID=UPI0035538F8A